MSDKEFLKWIHNRLEYNHEEDPRMDFMNKLRNIIQTIPEDKETPNIINQTRYDN